MYAYHAMRRLSRVWCFVNPDFLVPSGATDNVSSRTKYTPLILSGLQPTSSRRTSKTVHGTAGLNRTDPAKGSRLWLRCPLLIYDFGSQSSFELANNGKVTILLCQLLSFGAAELLSHL